MKSGPLSSATTVPAWAAVGGARLANVGASAEDAEAIATIKTVVASTFISEPLLSRRRVIFKIPSLLLPGGLNDFIFSTTNMLASASTLLSMVPMITLAIISGSIYGLVGVAQRMNMPDNFNEDRLAPKLDSSGVVGSSNDIAAGARDAAIGSDAVAATQGAAAAAGNSIDFKYSSAEQQQQATQLAQQVSAAKEHAESEVNAFAKATGSQFQSMSGKMVTLRHDDGVTKTYDFSDSNQVADAGQYSHTKSASAQVGAQIGGELGAGGKGAKASLGASGSNGLG